MGACTPSWPSRAVPSQEAVAARGQGARARHSQELDIWTEDARDLVLYLQGESLGGKSTPKRQSMRPSCDLTAHRLDAHRATERRAWDSARRACPAMPDSSGCWEPAPLPGLSASRSPREFPGAKGKKEPEAGGGKRKPTWPATKTTQELQALGLCCLHMFQTTRCLFISISPSPNRHKAPIHAYSLWKEQGGKLMF